ncbi:hypothetical protein M422DRAFT_263948 [Sphaerobolus stellatus SS14]|uniref:Uncharacterized protein n=1 Tax=Sphaerobolus stellatus (strain SS14) TaxID=990650 RepID=A0A0C9UXI6_SPHS4|nr:hypothetical protein M422DRAFT_263948 [Sphaerobolus stellatus SS14]
MHLSWDLRKKTSTDSYTTRTGEGFQQEVQQAYNQANFAIPNHKWFELTKIEAIARITMAVEQYDWEKEVLTEGENGNDGEAPIAVVEADHWKLGPPLPQIPLENRRRPNLKPEDLHFAVLNRI